mmetsp:Transcript_7975/g.25355  ORF Transcript_7975/g.25355 Transcript_7975/m.25355 type:complete len:350 (+) Transcript_7975:270-1319(+)
MPRNARRARGVHSPGGESAADGAAMGATSQAPHPLRDQLRHRVHALPDEEVLHEAVLVGAAVPHHEAHVEGQMPLGMLHGVDELVRAGDDGSADGLHGAAGPALAHEALLHDRKVHEDELLHLPLLALPPEAPRGLPKGPVAPRPGGDEEGRDVAEHLVDAVRVLGEGKLAVGPYVHGARHVARLEVREEVARRQGPGDWGDAPARHPMQALRELLHVWDPLRVVARAVHEGVQVLPTRVLRGQAADPLVDRGPHAVLLAQVALRGDAWGLADGGAHHDGVDDLLPLRRDGRRVPGQACAGAPVHNTCPGDAEAAGRRSSAAQRASEQHGAKWGRGLQGQLGCLTGQKA